MDVVWNERTKCLAIGSFYGNLKVKCRWVIGLGVITCRFSQIFSIDSDQLIHAKKVDDECWSLAWRPNGKETDDEGIDAARKSPDNFILAA